MAFLRSRLVSPVVDQTLGYQLNLLVFRRQNRYIEECVRRNVTLPAQGMVLDIGCGTGHFSPLFPRDRYLGIDVLPQYVTWAREKHGRRFEVCGFEEIDRLPDVIGAAFGVGILHHLDDALLERGLDSLARKLPTGGRVFFLEAAWPRRRWNKVGLMLRRMDRGEFIRTEEGYLRLLRRGFRVLSSETHSVFPLDYHTFLLER
ncbi:MAG: class I SAM-dependent methyltransferase [Myxococcota bacterium]